MIPRLPISAPAHRPRRWTRAASVAAAGLAALAASACSSAGEGPDDGEREPVVVATTTIVADLVRTIGGDDVRVESLMGPGVDPHLYTPSEGDMRRMAGARAVFYSGLHLEGKMADLLEQMEGRGVTTLAVAECVPERERIVASGFSGVYDPHVWFDVSLWRRAAECVRDALVELDASRAAAHRERGDAYLAELDDLHDWVGERVREIPEARRVLVTAHDAFGYFGRAYGVEVHGLMGVSTASEAGAADVRELAKLVATRRVPAVFVESSVPERFVEALREAVRARGHQVAIGGSLYSDALGSPGTPEEAYAGTVRHNVDTLVEALR